MLSNIKTIRRFLKYNVFKENLFVAKSKFLEIKFYKFFRLCEYELRVIFHIKCFRSIVSSID